MRERSLCPKDLSPNKRNPKTAAPKKYSDSFPPDEMLGCDPSQPTLNINCDSQPEGWSLPSSQLISTFHPKRPRGLQAQEGQPGDPGTKTPSPQMRTQPRSRPMSGRYPQSTTRSLTMTQVHKPCILLQRVPADCRHRSPEQRSVSSQAEVWRTHNKHLNKQLSR